MKTKNKVVKKAAVNKAVVSRIIHAPRELVFRAWTDPQMLAEWFGPEDFECRSVKADVKAGGSFRIHMASKKRDIVALGKYVRIVPNRRVQFTFEWEHYAMPDSVGTLDFESVEKKTRLTLTHEGLPDKEDAAEHKVGWTSLVRKFAGFMKQIKSRA